MQIRTFRGMDYQTNKWVHGGIYQKDEALLVLNYIVVDDFEFVGVTAESVGQGSGRSDKAGNEIFEGDIVKWDDGSDGRYWRVAIVKFDEGNSLCFECFACPAVENTSCHGHTFEYGSFIYTDTENHLEIIGNIHLNPELLAAEAA